MSEPVRLVTLARTKQLLDVIHAHDDQKLDLLILGASQAVLLFLGMSYEELTAGYTPPAPPVPESDDLDSDEIESDELESESESESESDFEVEPEPENPVPELEQVATAMLVGKIYDKEWTVSDSMAGRLPLEVEALLWMRRRELGIS